MARSGFLCAGVLQRGRRFPRGYHRPCVDVGPSCIYRSASLLDEIDIPECSA